MSLSMKLLIISAIFFIQCQIVSLETVTVTIPDGTLIGQVNSTSRYNTTFFSFRGIPYAEPPVDNLRFANPVANSPWNGTYNATFDRDECIQSSDLLGTEISGSEDCLFISVYTTSLTAQKPVMVWIHGGGFDSGNSSYSAYGPDNFLDHDVVFVSFQYRLGVFGFFSTGDEACPGNWGLKDQILALKWVQTNIEYFGGDPDKVTIFGQSAGAVSVHILMQTNLTDGLYRGAIMNSGTSLCLWGLSTRVTQIYQLLATNLIMSYSNTTTLVENMRGVDANHLHTVGWLTTWGLFLTDGLRGLPWAPALEPDIDGAVYINPSADALSNGVFQNKTILMGFNSNEAGAAEDIPSLLRIYLAYYDVSADLLTPYSMTDSTLLRWVAGTDIKYEYFGYSTISGDLEKLSFFVSADQFNRPIRKAASLMSNYTTVYFYEFGYIGELAGVTDRDYEGVGHGEEIQYLFNSTNNATSTDISVSDRLVTLWTNFVKYLNPTPEEQVIFNNTIWNPVNSSSSDFEYFSLNQSIVLATNPKQTDYAYYTGLWAKYGDEEDDDLTTY